MELKKIIKSTSFLVSSKAVQFIIGIIKSKLGAIFLGTNGMGIYSQVSYLTTMISQVTLLSMNDGLVKQVAQNKDNQGFLQILKGLVRSYSLLIAFSVLIVFSLCLIFAKPLTIFFLGDYDSLTYYLIGITGVPVLIINSLSFALLKSYKATKEISRANIFSSVLSLCCFVPLVYFLGILGSVISVTLNFAIVLYINNYQARKIVFEKTGLKFRDLFKAKTEKKYNRELLYFAFFGATTGLIYIGAESVCRSLVVNSLGIDKIGIYSPVIAWSGLLTGFIAPAIQLYLFPRFSECKSNIEISGIINDYFYLITFLMIPFLCLSIPFRNILIHTFYSKEFIEAGKYLPWHFIGLLFYMYWNILAMVLTPTGRIKTHGLFVTLMSLINVGIVFFLVPHIGLYGWMLKFIISPVLFSLVYFIYLKNQVDLKLSAKNLFLIAYAVVVSLVLIAVDSSIVKYFLCFILAGASLFFLSKHEKQVMIEKLTTTFNGKVSE